MRGRARRLVGLILAALVGGCSDDTNFSQFPGFDAWYAANPPLETVPTASEQALLVRHRPRVFLPEGHVGPIDFYRDYIAHGELVGGSGALISDQVDRATLNAHKLDPRAQFTHRPNPEPARAVIYGRVDHEGLLAPGCTEPVPLTFLTYHLVFRHSGLPAGLSGWQALPLGLVGDLDDWHQLDHYTAVSLALMPGPDGAPVPFAATFQQHNYTRTYLLAGADGPGSLRLPPDGRLPVDVALRSNELYPHRSGPVRRRAVSFMDVRGAGYLIAGADPPTLAADDLTAPARMIEPELVLLPPADAFYGFRGWLGARRRLPGRDGPPGADFNTLPPLKPKAIQLAVSYWHEGDRDFLELWQTSFADGFPGTIDPAPFVERLVRAATAAGAPLPCGG